MSRRPEKIIAVIGAVIVLILLGGFSITVLNMDEGAYQDVIVPIFSDTIPNVGTPAGYESIRTLAAWFGVTAFLTVVLVALGNLFVSHNKHPKRAALFYGATGLLVLFGSQLIAYPLAFIFFVTMGMCLLRQQEETADA